MSTIGAVTTVVGYPMQIIFVARAVYLAFKKQYGEATFCMSFSIMLILIVRLP